MQVVRKTKPGFHRWLLLRWLGIPLFSLFAVCSAKAQERIALGVPQTGSRLDLLRRLGDLVREALSPELGARGLLLLLGAALAYGILHALGPGHQKTLLAGTVLAEGGGLRGLVAAAGAAAASHAAAVIAFGLAFLGLERLAGGMGGGYGASAERWRLFLTKLSALVLVLIAARLLARRVRAAFGPRRAARGGEGTADCGCGHRHGEEGEAGLSARSLWTIAAGSLAPCPGALLFLFAGLASGNVAAGLLAVLALSAGMFLTLLGVGGLALYARGAGLRAAEGKRPAAARALRSAFEIGGAALILLFSLALLF